ncbi:MAG: DUF4132 domain-containing protein [Planctomycetota bacterium]
MTKASKPWMKQARPLVEAVGQTSVSDAVRRWFPLVGLAGSVERQWNGYLDDPSRSVPLFDNQAVLAGLAWAACSGCDDPPLTAVADAAAKCYQNIPKVGVRCESLGNSFVRAIANTSTRDAAVQLLRLEHLVRQPKHRKTINKAVAKLCEDLGEERATLEEAAVPDYGLVDGSVRERVADAEAELTVAPRDRVVVAWSYVDGKGRSKTSRSAPKAVRDSEPEAVEAIKRKAKEIESLLPAQRSRLELMLRETRTWRFDAWRSAYLDHGLVGTVARRLIWSIDGIEVVWIDGRLHDVAGKPIEFAATAKVQLWHPITAKADDVLRWRQRLEATGVTQPFKQAHREVYVLTDAERQTSVYSNRFAAHILKTPTLVAVAQKRRWVVGLFGGESSPKTELPAWNMRAEFWVDEADVGDGDQDDGYSFGPSYLATDQVRFHELGEQDPMPLDRVPPVVLSEVMRDVDLFVGLASVGNDPQWRDRGVEQRYRDYWHDFSFGDLGQTAQTRKAVLEKLIPRLKIAERCSFSDKFLVVHGDVRTYKIHLGSGNILMEPNDQYLCIVPDRRAEAATEKSYLPFEGDRTMSVIVSKALLLADDTKITDSTIISQIR